MRFSILIPVYNVENYLARCLESVLAQTYTDYEVILVDDGSTDGSSRLCDSFVSANPKNFQVIHKENQGLLSARRIAIAEAKGDFVCFLDSDDYWLPETLATIAGHLQKSHADLLLFGHHLVDDHNRILQTNHPSLPEGVYAGERKQIILEALLRTTSMNTLWAKCVRLECVDREKDYTHFYAVSSGEDLLQSLPLLDSANTIAIIHTPLYQYMQNTQSITQGKYLEKHVTSTFMVFKEVGTYVKKWGLHDGDYQQRMGLSVLYTIKQLIRRRVGEGAYTKEERSAIIRRLQADDIRAVMDYYEAKGNPISLQICYHLFSENKMVRFSGFLILFGILYRGKLMIVRNKSRA